MNNIKAAIFDLDGTLVDSMGVWSKIDIDFLGKRNIPLPANLKDDITHLSFQQVAEYFKDRFKLTESTEDIMNECHEMAYHEYSKNVKLKAGAKEYLEKLKASGVKIGLATSNSIPLLEATLKNNNIYSLFDAITVTDEVNKSKDNPDIYLLSAKKLNVAPEDCMVYEDILPAVTGAKLAGMKVTGVYDDASMDQMDMLKEKCDLYINNYHELLK